MEIEDRDRLARTPARETALTCIEAAIEAAHPKRVLREGATLDGETLSVGGDTYDLEGFESVLVVGGGKAAEGVAVVLNELLGERVSGAVVVPGGANDDADIERGGESRNETAGTTRAGEAGRIAVLAGDHPVPSERSVASTERVLELAEAADERTLVLAVVTGGASALLAAPAEGISLADLQAVTEDLLASGATIDDINAVRKHCSAIKGGLLARRAAPATVIGLLFSDVVGDPHGTIGSGPTAPDGTTFTDAMGVCDRYGIDAPAVRDRLERGVDGEIEETPGPGVGEFERVSNRVLANAHTALDAAGAAADDRGYRTRLLASTLRGEARELGKVHAAVAEECLATGEPASPPAVVLSGGEATVTVDGDGEGGPNLECALGAAIEFVGNGEVDDRVALCSVDTDGHDGATDAAGALVHGETLPPENREEARDALSENDALPVLDAHDALVTTGETGTNVNDLRVLVIEGVER